MLGGPTQPCLMRAKPEGVPNLHGLTRVSVIAEGDSRGKWMNAKNTIQTHAHTQIGYPRWPEPPTDRIARERPKVESLAKDRQIQIEFPKSKRPTKNRVAKQEILN